MDDPRELITNEPPPPSDDRVQDARPPRSLEQDSRDPYGPDDDYDLRRFRRETPLAGRGARLGARLLDGLIAIAVILPGVAIGVYLGVNARGGADEDMALIVGFGVGGLALLGLLIYQWYLLSTQGQTIGKKAVGVRIVRQTDESNPGFVSAVIMRDWLPNVIGQAPFVGGIFSLVNVLFIFGEERRCIHDHMAGTKVVEVAGEQYQEPSQDEARDQW